MQWQYVSLTVLFAILVFATYLIDPRLVQVHRKNYTTRLAYKTTQKQPSAALTVYHLHQQRFLNIITDCLFDTRCHFYQLHFQKTAGTTIETIFSKIFQQWNILESCCGTEKYNMITHNPAEYCLRRRAHSLQANATLLYNFVDTCEYWLQWMNNRSRSYNNVSINPMLAAQGINQTSNNDYYRAVVITAYREPVARALSYANQRCNKYLDTRDERMQQMCKRCSLQQDYDYWKEFMEQQDEEMVQHYNLINTLSQKYSYNQNSNNKNATTNIIKFVAFDTNDVGDMLSNFRARVNQYTHNRLHNERYTLAKHYSKLWPADSHSNVEAKDTCDFVLDSEMVKTLSKSALGYRNITRGV